MNDHPKGFTFGQNPAYRPSALYFFVKIQIFNV